MSKVTSIACAVLMAAFAGACEDTVDDIDRSTDCAQICDDFKMCFSTSDYDVDECTDSCTEMEDDEAQIDECENCLDDASCGESIGCTAECAGLIPVTTD
jgi:hypothetical protein